MEWCEDKTLNLINVYHRRILLWSSCLMDYENRIKSHDALHEINVSLELTKMKLRKKFKP